MTTPSLNALRAHAQARAPAGRGVIAVADLRAWLWLIFGWDLIDWDEGDLRF